MRNTGFKIEWRPLVLLMAIGGIVGRPTIGAPRGIEEKLLDSYWANIWHQGPRGNNWAPRGNYWPTIGALAEKRKL